MTFRREMYDAVNIIFFEYLIDRVRITDICPDKSIIISVLHIFQIFQIASVGQLIYVNDPDFVIIFFKHVMNIV